MLTRRGLITGLISLAAAPAIVRIESLMPVKVMHPIVTGVDWASKPDMAAAYFIEYYEGEIVRTAIPMDKFYRMFDDPSRKYQR